MRALVTDNVNVRIPLTNGETQLRSCRQARTFYTLGCSTGTWRKSRSRRCVRCSSCHFAFPRAYTCCARYRKLLCLFFCCDLATLIFRSNAGLRRLSAMQSCCTTLSARNGIVFIPGFNHIEDPSLELHLGHLLRHARHFPGEAMPLNRS